MVNVMNIWLMVTGTRHAGWMPRPPGAPSQECGNTKAGSQVVNRLNGEGGVPSCVCVCLCVNSH